MQFYMEFRDYDSILMTCENYGSLDPSLWVSALMYFGDPHILSPSSQPYLVKVIDHVDEHGLLSFLEVIRVLSRNGDVTIGLVKDFVLRRIEKEQMALEDAQKDIESFQAESAMLKKDLVRLKEECVGLKCTKLATLMFLTWLM